MYDWIIKVNEPEVNEITLNTASCSMVIRKTEKVNLTTGERQLLGEPKKELVIRGFDNGVYAEVKITGDFNMEVKQIGGQNTLDDIPSYFNYER